MLLPFNEINMARFPIQDSLQNTDTLIKLVPIKIKSSDGAIIPKEAIEWTALEPSFPTQQPTSGFNQNYIWLAIGIVFLLALIAYWWKRRQKAD